MALGTDCYPHDMVEEMWIAGLISKEASGRVDLSPTGAVFEIAKLGATRALGRDDLGCIGVGAKADLARFAASFEAADARSPEVPNFLGTATAVRDVFVGGELVVKDWTLLMIDRDDALDRLQEG